jgi:cytochrome P450/NADPH-cytochrome P450 reductase
LQEKATQLANGQKLGEALLFFGCDARDVDFLYYEELSEWETAGVVSVRPAFSVTKENGIEFVQNRIWQDRADVIRLFKGGAVIYVCGDGRHMAPAVRATLIKIYQEETRADNETAKIWANEIEKNTTRYVTDIFG